MSRTPFHALTDAQLEALRRLLAAAVVESSNPPGFEDLHLVSLADAEAARRAARRAPRGVPDPRPQSPLPPDHLAARLSGAVASVRPGTTSTTKWNGIASILARVLRLPPEDVYVTSVGGLSRNIAVRLAQSRRAREATVAVVVWAAGAEPLQQALSAGARACAETPRLTLIFTIRGGDFDLAAIVSPALLPAPDALTLAYPDARVVNATTEPTPVGGPRPSTERPGKQ